MTDVVRFESVHYAIGAQPILRGLTLSVARGETLVLLGRSGSGKTTALKLINGLLRPDRGKVLVDGEPVSGDLIALRRRIGYVIQESGLLPHWSVERNIALVPGLLGWPRERIQSRVSELLNALGLEPQQYSGRYPQELSGGQRQRVGIARALAADPELLLFDEPFGALDPVMRCELQDQFLKLRESFGKTSVFVTHDIREAMRLGTRIALLHEGVLEFAGTPDEFRQAGSEEALRFLGCLRE